MHTVIRTIKGRQYEYSEESYRIPGVKNPRKHSRYIGPVNAEPVDPITGKRRKKGLLGAIHEAVRNRQPWEETEEQQKARMAAFDAERARTVRNNELLSGKTITLEAMKEVAASQQPLVSASDRASETPPSDAGRGE